MLKDHFYTVTNITHQDNTIIAGLKLNSAHPIFQGHFPWQPVVPGACLLQIVKEILSDVAGTNYQLSKGSNLKFIAPIDPLMTPEAELKIVYKDIESGLQINASLSVNEVVCFKMQGCFIKS